MTSRDPSFRCATASRDRDETLTGTASTVRAFLLIEHQGPWGVDALRDARLPEGLGDSVTRVAAAARVRPLLIRRPDRDAPRETRVFAAFAHPSRPWIETTVLPDIHQLLDLDLAALGAGHSPGLTPYEGSLFCVCTHGRHDACCAELGRPVAAALVKTYPEETWEVSHIGGDRFAGNVLVLPHGFYYGRVDAASSVVVADSHVAGNVDLDHLRGRSSYPMPVQFAELSLRRHLDERALDAVRLVSSGCADDVTHATFEVADSRWTVQVRTAPSSELQQLTCRARRDNPVQQHELLAIAQAP